MNMDIIMVNALIMVNIIMVNALIMVNIIIVNALIMINIIMIVNVNVNVISRTALIRNRVSRRVCTCACHVWVSSIKLL